MTFTITIPLWLPLGYLAIGLLLWLPLEYRAWLRIQRCDRGSFWQGFRERLPRRPWLPLVVMVVWPVILWKELT